MLAIGTVLALLSALPERIRVLPPWVGGLLAATILIVLVATALAGARPAWVRVESVVALAFVAFALAGNLLTLWQLVRAVIGRSAPASGLALLSSSVALWCINVVIFSLLYWQVDRGGPAGRYGYGAHRLPDFSFPQAAASEEEVRRDWRPTFPDYLFLSYCTATAFSPTDVAPFTTRAKMAMMLESSVSLATLALVAARAINILAS